MKYVETHKLDGVDIDWEEWTFQNEQNLGGNDPVESQQLVALLKHLREKLPSMVTITADIAPGNWMGVQYLPEIQQYVDYVNLMAFDFTGQWEESNVAHHSDFRTFEQAISHTVNRGFKKDKLLVGIPIYGKHFIDGGNETVINIDHDQIFSMPNIEQANIDEGQFQNIYFESPINAQRKARLVSTENLAGIFFFHALADDKLNSVVKSTQEYVVPIECIAVPMCVEKNQP